MMLLPLQGSDGDIMLISKVHELHTIIHDILDNALSKWVGNTADILAYLFSSASRQHHEGRTLQFSCLKKIKDAVPPS